MGLEPIVLQNLPTTGDTIIEKLERYLGQHQNVGFACVLLTPDDESHKIGRPEEKKYRARQNVVLEMGMVLSRLGRRRVAILIKGTVEQPSDIAGLIYIPFQERVDEVRNQLFRELQAAGYTPRTDAL
jgi:predicted nucleotide-binding protein